MGSSKAMLPVGDELMLQRMVRLLTPLVEPLAVVAARGQSLPPVPDDVRVVYDQVENQGPVGGLHAGLTALQDSVDAAYVTGCDVPLLVPEFVRKLIGLLGSNDVVVPIDGEFHFPLAAVYRAATLPHLESMLADKQRRPIYLYDRVATRRVPVEEFRDVDPELATLENLNRPEEYQRVLQRLNDETRI